MKRALIPGGILATLIALGWAGLRVSPAPFPPVAQPPAAPETIPLPAGLPAPVERFYRELYGERVPVVTSAVISGRGRLRLGGLTFPARFRFTHDAGRDYRHYIETTVFGVPVMKVNEYYVNGRERMELPFGVQEGDPRLDQGGNLGLWAESIWLPSIFLTDPRVAWEPVDEVTALLVVPFGEQRERFVVRFDPETGLPRLLEAMRYKSVAASKTLWLNEIRAWERIGGWLSPTEVAVIWLDDGSPWLEATVEEIVYNAEVDTSLEARGP